MLASTRLCHSQEIPAPQVTQLMLLGPDVKVPVTPFQTMSERIFKLKAPYTIYSVGTERNLSTPISLNEAEHPLHCQRLKVRAIEV